MRLWLHLTTLAAVLLCGICLALPVAQWASIPTNTAHQILAGVVALALGICKLAFFPLGWEQARQRQWLPAALLLSFATLLLAISTTATRDLLDSYTGERKQVQAQGDTVYKTLQDKLTSLNNQINSFNGLIAADQRSQYRQRAYDQLQRLQQLEADRDSVLQQLEAAQASSAAVQARFGIGAGDSSAMFSASLITALCVHLGCVLAVMAASAWRVSEGEPARQEETAKTVKAVEAVAESVVKQPVTPATEQPVKQRQEIVLSVEQQQLADRIVAGEFGTQPVLRDVINTKVLPGGFNKVKPVFKHLEQQGRLKLNGKGFHLV